MPELPEVEVVRDGLARWVVGRSIAAVEVRHPRAVRRHCAGPADFAAALEGSQLVAAYRRGKYLWLPLARPERSADERVGRALVGHLGMSGQLLVAPPDEPPGPHLRVRLVFTDAGPELRFVDQRTFGSLFVEHTAAHVPVSLAHIARDPMDQAFDDAAFVRGLRRRRTGLKRALLDQTLVSGIGNIYADEALWRTRLHWARATETLPASTVRAVLAEVRAVLAEAVAAGGTSFDRLYVNVNGQSGYFDRSLAVYGRAGLPCQRCETPIRREAFMNRSAYSCPRCQPRPRRGRW